MYSADCADTHHGDADERVAPSVLVIPQPYESTAAVSEHGAVFISTQVVHWQEGPVGLDVFNEFP